MTGGLRGWSESVLSLGGERLQLPWLPHAIEGGVEEEDVGEWERLRAPIRVPVSHRYLLVVLFGGMCQTGLISYRRDLSATLCSYLLAEDEFEPSGLSKKPLNFR